jgi:hypothetical protein
MTTYANTIKATTLLSLDIDNPDVNRSFGPLLVPPSLTRNSLLPPKKTDVISLFTNSANTNALTVAGNGQAVTDDTSNPLVGSYSPVLNFTASVSTTRHFTTNNNTSTALNLTNKIVSLSLRLLQKASTTPSGFYIRVRLYSSGTPTSSLATLANYHTYDFIVDSSQKPLGDFGNNWQKLSATIQRFTAVGTGADLTAITFAAIEIKHPSTVTPAQIAVGSITSYDNALNRGAVVICLDGYYRTQWNNALPLLKKYDIPASIFMSNTAGSLKNDIQPVFNTARISNVTASAVTPLIRITMSAPNVFTTGQLVAVAGIAGVTDNAVAMTGTTVYTITKIDSLNFDLVGSTYGGTTFDPVASRADANFSVTSITNVDQSAVDSTIRVTVANAGVYVTGNIVTVLGVTGVTLNGTFTITQVDANPTLQFTKSGSTFSGAYTGGGYVIYGITSGNTQMTMKQIDLLQEMYGWQVGSYANRTNLRADFLPLDQDGVASEFQNHQALLMSRGYKGIQDCVYFNDTGSADQNIYGFLKKNYRSIRAYHGQVSFPKNETLPVGDPQNVRAYGVFPGDLATKLIQLVDDAITYKDVCILVFHEIERSPNLFGNSTNYLGYNYDDFKTFTDALGTRKLSGTVDAITLENAYEIGNSRYV